MDMHFFKEVTGKLSTEIKFISGSTLFKISKNIYSFKCVCMCVCYVYFISWQHATKQNIIAYLLYFGLSVLFLKR